MTVTKRSAFSNAMIKIKSICENEYKSTKEKRSKKINRHHQTRQHPPDAPPKAPDNTKATTQDDHAPKQDAEKHTALVNVQDANHRGGNENDNGAPNQLYTPPASALLYTFKPTQQDLLAPTPRSFDTGSIRGRAVVVLSGDAYFMRGKQSVLGVISPSNMCWMNGEGPEIKRVIDVNEGPQCCGIIPYHVKNSDLVMRLATRKEIQDAKEAIASRRCKLEYTPRVDVATKMLDSAAVHAQN